MNIKNPTKITFTIRITRNYNHRRFQFSIHEKKINLFSLLPVDDNTEEKTGNDVEW